MIHSKCIFKEDELKIPILRVSLDIKIPNNLHDPLHQLAIKQIKKIHKVKKIDYNSEEYQEGVNKFMKSFEVGDLYSDRNFPIDLKLKNIEPSSFNSLKDEVKDFYTKVKAENLLFLEIASREISGYSEIYSVIRLKN